MHKAIGMVLCLSGMVFALLGVFIERYTWHFFAVAGVLTLIMLYHLVKYWGPVLKEYNKAMENKNGG